MVLRDHEGEFPAMVMLSALFVMEVLRGWGRQAAGRDEVSWAWRLATGTVKVLFCQISDWHYEKNDSNRRAV